MIAAHRLLSALLIGAVASSSHAFKASNTRSLTVSSPEPDILLSEDVPMNIFKSSRNVGRAGDCTDEGLVHVHKADVVKFHGITAILFAVLFLVETLGVKVPLVGASAIIPGFDGENDTIKFIVRFLSSILVGLGWYEIENASSDSVQDIFTKYHYFVSAVTIWTMKEIGGTGLHWVAPVLTTLFLIGGIVSK